MGQISDFDWHGSFEIVANEDYFDDMARVIRSRSRIRRIHAIVISIIINPID